MTGDQFTDAQVANMVRMLMRDQIDHEMICVMARDRILALSARIAELVAERDNAREDAARQREVSENYLSHCDAACKQIDQLEDERDELTALAESRRVAGQAVVDRWDTPAWKDVPHTAIFIDQLRAALAATPSSALAELRRSVRVEVLMEYAKQMAGCEENHAHWLYEESKRIAAGVEVDDVAK